MHQLEEELSKAKAAADKELAEVIEAERDALRETVQAEEAERVAKRERQVNSRIFSLCNENFSQIDSQNSGRKPLKRNTLRRRRRQRPSRRGELHSRSWTRSLWHERMRSENGEKQTRQSLLPYRSASRQTR